MDYKFGPTYSFQEIHGSLHCNFAMVYNAVRLLRQKIFQWRMDYKFDRTHLSLEEIHILLHCKSSNRYMLSKLVNSMFHSDRIDMLHTNLWKAVIVILRQGLQTQHSCTRKGVRALSSF